MKKLVFFLMIIAIAVISTVTLTDFNGTGKLHKHGADSFSKHGNMDSPQILFIMNKDPRMTKWSPSLWWSYNLASVQKGC